MFLVHTWYDLEWLKVKYTIVQGIVNIRCSCTNDCNFISSDVNNLQKYHATRSFLALEYFPNQRKSGIQHLNSARSEMNIDNVTYV